MNVRRGTPLHQRPHRHSTALLLAYLAGLAALAIVAGAQVVRAASASGLGGGLAGAQTVSSGGSQPLLAAVEKHTATSFSRQSPRR